ncbi:Holliday junction branch migration protein RuvA [Dethiobacter alkaliphilus]|uniref:Holliday junction branch migration complex subunit RuvA n=1 Tax=Dethiobacter alkaliphilus AHT 1 TaxID=555088 RepID=C0GKF3_DETAL|nr:Holliday junction branch migration protein RuvA [Dethiobacter alkaliphilus]EEG76196.1 Holliday junction DNA helicase RuvA [Dethiobacter alkaliphilus AHT 1]
MFNYIRGTLVQKGKDTVVLDNQGIGWQISVPSTVLSGLHSLDEEVKLFTYLAVREDDLHLYGFLTADDLSLFKLLISVSGIGPKAALGILSSLSAAEFHLAVMHENVKALTRVPGVGPKSAKRLIVELKEKVAALGTPQTVSATPQAGGTTSAYHDALEALVALGYNGSEAQAALQTIEDADRLSTEELIKKALAHLGLK